MTLRTASRAGQWRLWALAALVAAAVYVIVVRALGEGAPGELTGVLQQRVLLPILAIFGLFAYETRWRGDSGAGASAPTVADLPADESAAAAAAPETTVAANAVLPCSEEAVSSAGAAPTSMTAAEAPVAAVDLPSMKPEKSAAGGDGAAEYAQARQIPHQRVPDYSQANDSKYLELLGRSAACGYPPALAKLGEYAVRRAAWVEAYYWTWQARRAGMPGLEVTLRSIRLSWATEGYRSQSKNVHRLFSAADGSVGRALLNLDSGRDVRSAKAYLRANRPELGI